MVVIIFLTLSVVTIYSVSFAKLGFILARSQLLYGLLGLAVMILVARLDYQVWRRPVWLILGLTLVALVGLFFIGSNQFGATRWYNLGTFHFQPSELAKLSLIFVAAWLLAESETGWQWRQLGFYALVTGAFFALIFFEPDLGSASVILVLGLAYLSLAKLQWRQWATLGLLVVLALPVGYRLLRPYQRERVATFLNPESDKSGKSYNVNQAKIAIGSGGLLGQGLGQGSQSAQGFLPVAHTDFIFASIAEATGTLGAGSVLALYGWLLWRSLRIAEQAKDLFGRSLVFGVVVMLSYQVAVNVGMNLGLLPVTGITLPLISFGGTSLLISSFALGLVLAVERQSRGFRLSR